MVLKRVEVEAEKASLEQRGDELARAVSPNSRNIGKSPSSDGLAKLRPTYSVTGTCAACPAASPNTPAQEAACGEFKERFACGFKRFDLPLDERERLPEILLRRSSRHPPWRTAHIRRYSRPRRLASSDRSGMRLQLVPDPDSLPPGSAAIGHGGFSGSGGVEAKLALLMFEATASLPLQVTMIGLRTPFRPILS